MKEKISPNDMLKVLVELAESRGFKLQEHKHFVEVEADNEGAITSIAAYETIIFDKEFAKAVYGDAKNDYELETPRFTFDGDYRAKFNGKVFEFHLMLQVISDNPLEYMYDNRKI